MDNKEFQYYRKRLKKTQKQLAQLLASSSKTIQSYEQGWRNIPANVEKQLLFLISQKNQAKIKPCWSIKKCSSKQKKNCPVWEFRADKLCWFINGTMCEGEAKKSWKEKVNLCRSCEVFKSIILAPDIQT